MLFFHIFLSSNFHNAQPSTVPVIIRILSVWLYFSGTTPISTFIALFIVSLFSVLSCKYSQSSAQLSGSRTMPDVNANWAPRLQSCLKACFGLETLKPWQAGVVEAWRDGKDCLCLSGTGRNPPFFSKKEVFNCRIELYVLFAFCY